jgi:hypothetical protein
MYIYARETWVYRMASENTVTWERPDFVAFLADA